MRSKWCSKSSNAQNKEKESHNESGAISSLAFITQQVNNSTTDLSALKLANIGTKKKGKVIPLQHHIFQDDQWMETKFLHSMQANFDQNFEQSTRI